MKLIAAIVLFILASPSYAAMYKWTDEHGNTHYGEQPPNYKQAQNIAPPPPARSPADSRKRIDALRTGISQQAKDTNEAKAKAADKARKDKKTNVYCEQLRQRISAFQNKPRIRQLGKDGNYSYLGAEKKQKQQQKMQQSLVKHCS